MKNLKTSVIARNAQLDALGALANEGYLRIYDGTQPVNPESPSASGTLLSTCRFGTPAFGPAADGVLTANPIAQDGDIAANGNASWFRVLKSDGETVLWDGSVGVEKADLILRVISLVRHAALQINRLTYTQPQ